MSGHFFVPGIRLSFSNRYSMIKIKNEMLDLKACLMRYGMWLKFQNCD